MSRIATKRLQKELADLQTKGCPTGCRILQAENLEEWIIALRVLGETVYEGEEFALRFRFNSQYPIDSPEVTFLNTADFSPPTHPHVYTNGHICASVLGSGWSPVLNVQSLLLTMQSMLASCKKKELPPDNDRYVRNAPKSPKDTRWAYHDGA
ncbi:hypothetical protein JCM10908_006400 [Rhodotorula pacifica]|uniref:ubiquitin-conjugating enzyme E2 n=1 Tax=Rhodotorula pacifica TaxID=1495444 RepID=UPI003176C57D